MNHLLDTLCDVLEDELERQQNVLAVSKALRDALLAHDAEVVEARTQALDTLIRDTTTAETDRHDILRKVVDYYELPTQRQTMSDLVRQLPEPWCNRLAHIQRGLQETIRETKRVTTVCTRVVRRSRQLTERCLAVLNRCEVIRPAAYDALGNEPSHAPHAVPALIDQRG